MNPEHPRTLATPCPGSGPALSEAICEKRADHVLIRARGEFDYDTTDVLRDALAALDGDLAVIDLSHVTFADTALVHALLDARAERELVLTGPLPHHLQMLLDETGTRNCFVYTAESNHT
ncbi:STAS domain-containing protein [Streptomyces sp. NPDC012794]|uniref:STAS domain-containing protein n=1 Tax=Streptomyces sp. NPDC012794 TaxID=3364850 RepID=UPI0036851493